LLKKITVIFWLFLAAEMVICRQAIAAESQFMEKELIELPKVTAGPGMSLEEAIFKRRSLREFSRQSLNLAQVGRLAWAAQGSLDSGTRRTIPSAGALNPLELYVVASNVDGLAKGVYKYHSVQHKLRKISGEPRLQDLAKAALDQTWIADAPAVLIIVADYERTTSKYGRRGQRYVHMEVGHAAQNVYLEATALGLGTVLVGAFSDREVKKRIGLVEDEEPLAIMPVGWPR